MMHDRAGGLALAAVVWATAALAEERQVAGHQVTVAEDGMGSATLVVDGEVLHENGVIFLDEAAQALGGLSVLTGIAGSGGNACGAAPFVLALPEGGKAGLYGPLEGCREFALEVRPDALVFSTEPLPSEPGEVWTWTPAEGFVQGPPVAFGGTSGWDAFDSLAGQHPVEALKLTPVLEALQAGLGPDYAAFAERISDLGSGDRTATGYLGQACLKYSCDEDWAVLYLDPVDQGVFAAWAVAGEAQPRLWPADRALWPAEALAALPGPSGE
jgi:hypothetical protein